MTNFKEYFRSHLKANLRPIIYILAVVLLLTYLFGVNLQPTMDYDYNIRDVVPYYQATLGIPVTFLCVLAYVLPVMEFSFFKKRINLDCAYALPISRRAMGVVHYLSGLVILFGTFTLSYLLNFLLMLSRGPGHYSFLPLLPHYFLSLLLGFALYSVMVFVFCEANTKGDGIWFMLLYTFVFSLVVSALGGGVVSSSLSIPWMTIFDLTAYHGDLVSITKPEMSMMNYWGDPVCVGWFIFWVTVGIGAALGFFFTFGKRRMEKTEEISDSYFGFRTLIPIYAVAGMLVFPASVLVLFWFIIELFALLGYTIYRRGFRYRKSDIVILVSLLVFLFA